MQADEADLAWVDAVADQFELAWQKEPVPHIGRFLAKECGSRKALLLAELVKIDLEYRWQAGQRRKLEEYLAEFPELLTVGGSLPDDLVLHARQVQDRIERRPTTSTVSCAAANESTRPSLALPRCPECGNTIPSPDRTPLEVTCPNCGGSFRVAPASDGRWWAGDLPRTLGKLQLLELLGAGSFGAVYKARDAELGRLVAVKVPHAGHFAEAGEEERFFQEARSAARLQHPSIVALHAVAHDGGMPFLVCEYIEGRTLAKAIQERRPGFREAAEMIAEIAEALDYAHRQGVVHRDIKPGNILLDASGRPHVADFGLARLDERSIMLTHEGQVLGTPAYMAPEQARGNWSEVNGRSDQYSLGVILYELLTGELPFRGQVRMLLAQVISDEPRPPRRLNDRIPRDLENICLKAMSKLPASRYATTGEMAADLRRFLAGQPTHARPINNAARLARWCRRKPALAGLGAAAAIFLAAFCISLGVAAIQSHRSLLKERGLFSEAEARHGQTLLEQDNALGLLNLVEARQIAEGTPAAISRSLIWSGWYGAIEGQLLQVIGHDSPARLLVFSPDGTRLVTTRNTPADLAQLWDVRTGRPIGSPVTWDRGGINAVAFSGDSRTFVVTGFRTRVFDAFTGEQIGPARVEVDLKAWTNMSLSPDGKRVLAVSDSQLQLWDISSDQPGVRLKHSLPTPAGVPDATFSAEGATVAVVTYNGQGGSSAASTITLFNVASGEQVAVLRVQGMIRPLAFSRDGQRLAVGTWYAHETWIWDASDGRLVAGPLSHGEDVHAVVFSPDGSLLATACFDGTARIWDATTGARLQELHHQSPVFSLDFHASGKWLATGTDDNTARLWNVATGEVEGWPLRHQGAVTRVVFSPDGDKLATASSDAAVRLWRIVPRELPVLDLLGRVWGLAVSPDGKRLATTTQAGQTGMSVAQLWSTADWAPLGEPLKHPTQLFCVTFSPDSKLVAIGGGHFAHIYDASTFQTVKELDVGSREVRDLAFSPNGRLLATGEADGLLPHRARVWSVESGEMISSLTHDQWVTTLAFLNESLLVTGCDDGHVRVWDLQTGKVQRAIRHGDQVNAVAVSPDGKLLATAASPERGVRLWNIGDGSFQALLQTRSGVSAMAFSPDGRLLAMGTNDGSARLWEVATGFPCGPPLTHENRVCNCVAFSPDGKWLASGGFDQKVRIWPIASTVYNLEEMELLTWVALGAQRDGQDKDKAIPWREWQQLRAKLESIDKQRASQQGPN